MTAEDFANLRPDLAANWTLANDPTWLAENPQAGQVAAFIQSFGSLDNFLSANFGQTFDAPAPAPAPTPQYDDPGNQDSGPADYVSPPVAPAVPVPPPMVAAPPAATAPNPTSLTADQYNASRPDLAINWQRAHDPSWTGSHPESADVVAFILSFPIFESYLEANYGGAFSAPLAPPAANPRPPDPVVDYVSVPTPPAPIIVPAPGNPIQGDPAHVYVGRDGRGDVWQVFDGQNVIEWAVPAGTDSRNVIAGTVTNLGPPSIMTVAQAPLPAVPVSPAVVAAPPSVTPAIDIFGSTAQTAPNPTPMTADQYSASRPDLAANWQRAHDPSWTNSHPEASDVVAFILSFPTFESYLAANYGGMFSAPATPPAAISPQQGDPSHVYVGRDARGDVWQLFDAANNRVLEWAVATGDDSRNIIAGTLNDLGPPSSMTIAQAPGGYVPPTAASGGNTGAGGNTLPPASTISLAKPTIQVGMTAAGLPIFQLVDSGGLVKQWITDGAAIMDLVNAPTYGALFHTTATDAPATSPGTGVVSGGGGTTTSLAKPTIQVGQTASGLPVMQLVDAGGTVKQWIADPYQGTRDLVNAATYGVLLHTAAVDSTAVSTSLAKPRIQVGTTTAGWPIYQLVDDGGTVKQWIVDGNGSVIDLVNAPTYGALYHDSVTDAAIQNNGGGTVVTTTTATAQSKSSTPLLLAGGALLLVYAATRQTKRQP